MGTKRVLEREYVYYTESDILDMVLEEKGLSFTTLTPCFVSLTLTGVTNAVKTPILIAVCGHVATAITLGMALDEIVGRAEAHFDVSGLEGALNQMRANNNEGAIKAKAEVIAYTSSNGNSYTEYVKTTFSYSRRG